MKEKRQSMSYNTEISEKVQKYPPSRLHWFESLQCMETLEIQHPFSADYTFIFTDLLHFVSKLNG